MKRVEELLNNQGGSYILPFLWMHGENHEVIREEMDRIEECGIREICLESRPHPDYCGHGWWVDVDFIMDEARKRGLRIWILDDDKFPTGHANGAFLKKPALAKVYLAERHMDILGPANNGSVLIRPFLGEDGKLLAVLACKKPDAQSLAVSEEDVIDLTGQVHDGLVYFELPEGRYRLFLLYTTQLRGGRPNYMNLIDSESVKVLINEVYEKHYEHYKHDFGKTFAGFFSDEAEIGNTMGYDFHELLGKRDVKLPWSEELLKELRQIWKEELVYQLPALWYDMGEKTAKVRSQYMEAVTKLVAECFSGQLGSWCKKHGVEYIGHIIEDDNAHARLGCSIGHYFREQSGQHMSGIDVVHHQIIPGFEDKIHQWIAGDCDGEFFHFGLAKLGSSCAHIDPEKKGRALCEIFGNYGWAEGVSLMKWLTNHMLVRGINKFVPHAFSMKFPDPDCPPHFYAGGNNPQYPFFIQLMRYMNRVSHLVSEGTHIADAAVLYHAEAEWGGKKVQLFQQPVRKLLEAQLDCDVIPADIFAQDYVKVEEKQLVILKERYGCLIVPYCEAIPEGAVDFIRKAAAKGLIIYMVDHLPETDTMGNTLPREFGNAVNVVRLQQLVKAINQHQKSPLYIWKTLKTLRSYCYQQEDGRIFLLFNENTKESVDTNVTISKGEFTAMEEYDAMNNKITNYAIQHNTFRLYLEPGQMKILIPNRRKVLHKQPICVNRIKINCEWRVLLKEAGRNTDFKERLILKADEKLPNMNGPKYFSHFSGTFRYEGRFELKEVKEKQCMLFLPKFGDCAKVSINDREAGMLLSSPDRIEVTKLLQKGNNILVIEVANTLVWRLRDGASTHMQLEATGLGEAPVLEFYE